MCGIIAYVGNQVAAPILLSGLRHLEYRGYDSSGIALTSRGKLKRYRAAGKLRELENKLPDKLIGKTGIGHTRWATHGEPTNENAHPHTDTHDQICIVHNGIIENANELKSILSTKGCQFDSQTDSEVIAHLIALTPGKTFLDRVRAAISQLQGTYGLVVMDHREPGQLVAARSGSPVIIGIGENEMFVASDSAALSRHTREVVHLDDNEVALISAKGFSVTTLDAKPANKSSIQISSAEESYDRGLYDHYMLKEIEEQPESIARTLSGRLDRQFNTAHLGGLNLDSQDLANIQRVKILGCGSAYYAGLSGADMIETLARLPASAEPAAEFRYRNPVIEQNVLYVVVSQSGETFDTLAAVREIKRKGGCVLGINNVVGSTIAREVDGGIYMHAGAEISVASTKAYTSMLLCFVLLALHLGRIRDLSPQQGEQLITDLDQLPDKVCEALQHSHQVADLAKKYHQCHSAFYIGRTQAYPIALEGAQKLKEISYIHAEAYPASELKHGPLALICPATPTLIILPDNALLSKSLSTLHEVRARKAPVIALTNATNPLIRDTSEDLITAPQTHPLLHPIVMAISLQLFAYYCAIEMGRDVDQPRHLAKSVTVE